MPLARGSYTAVPRHCGILIAANDAYRQQGLDNRCGPVVIQAMIHIESDMYGFLFLGERRVTMKRVMSIARMIGKPFHRKYSLALL